MLGYRHLGIALAFLAGALNASGYVAVRQHTSHMTGIVLSVANNLVLGASDLVFDAVGASVSFLLCFVTGSQNALFTNSRTQKSAPRTCLPLALLLCGLAIMPALDDLREIAQRNSQ